MAKKLNPLDKKFAGKFTLGQKAKTGAWLPLCDCAGDPLGVAVKVISTDSEAHKRKRQKALDKYAHKSQAWKDKHLRQIVGDFQAREVVLDWWFYDTDDDDLIEFEDQNKPAGGEPYNASQLAEWLGKLDDDEALAANDLIEQIDAFTTDSSNFRDDADLGKSVSTSGLSSVEVKA